MTNKAHSYGDYSRFFIEPFKSPRGGFGECWFVRDAWWTTRQDIQNGHRSPVVAQFDTHDECIGFCRNVERDESENPGTIKTIPHESNFVGWPELELRVKEHFQFKG